MLLKSHRAALAVGQATVVQHLQQHVEHVGMRLLDLVEQDHLVGPAAHRFGEHAALVVADIARRRADQPADGVLLHELAHVDAHHGVVVVEQEVRQRLGQLGLADARGAQEQERADRPVGVLQACPRAAHGVGDGVDRLVLADHPLVQLLFHAQQLVPLAFEHLVDGNAGPARDHRGDVLGRDLFLHAAAAAAARCSPPP